MDSITKTTQLAFTNYFNSLRKLGNIRKQDKYKLLVLWFFYYLKYDSDFLYKWVNATDDTEGHFEINRELESEVNSKFISQINCLSSNSCFIKLRPTDNCLPILETLWTSDDEDDISLNINLLVTNATNVMKELTDVTSIDDVIDFLNGNYFTNGSAAIVDNQDKFIES